MDGLFEHGPDLKREKETDSKIDSSTYTQYIMFRREKRNRWSLESRSRLQLVLIRQSKPNSSKRR